MHNDHLTSRVFREHYRRILRKVDKVLFCSDFIRQRSVSRFPEYAGRFCTVVNSTDTDYFSPIGKELARQDVGFGHSADPLVVYAGRLVPEKGVHVLIDAFAQLILRVPEAKLLIAGASFFAESPRSPYQRTLSKRAKPVEESIEFLGYVPHARIRALYCAADVVVVPSVWQEPFGLVVIEAMACGATVVASNVGGIPDIIDCGVNGVLVAPDDAAGLCQALIQLIENGERRTKMGQAARRKVELEFSWEKGAADFWRYVGCSA